MMDDCYMKPEPLGVGLIIGAWNYLGSLVQNTVLFQIGVNTLPFGGVGNSGIGAYHGKHTFNTYSQMKPILRTGTKMDFLLKVIYPPHNKSKIKQFNFNFLQVPSSCQWSLRPYLMILLVVMIAAAVKVYRLPSFMYKFF
uniref:Aldehyde dehydrogenase domain-containing protein n=1 Tax=Amphimedon queenslandica TaxID=400682 RepID=A0A1X7SW18_AMPQE